MELAPVQGYIHSDSARCAVTGRLDVERLAVPPEGRYLSYSRTTLLVSQFGSMQLRGTCNHVAQRVPHPSLGGGRGLAKFSSGDHSH